MSSVKYLVTGSRGLVGYAIKDIVTQNNQDEGYVFIDSSHADLTQFNECLDILSYYKPTGVIHLAANVGGLYKNMLHNVQIYEDNIMMNTNIIKACFKTNVKQFVGCLSTCVFPDKVLYPITECQLFSGEPHESNYGYAYAKRMMEIQCKAYRQQYGLDYRCVIPTNIYGPNDNFNIINGHVIPSLIHKCYIAKNQNDSHIIISGSGRPLRQFVYSYDLANILLKLNNILYKDPIIIADSLEYSISSIVDIIVKKFNFTGDIIYDERKSDGQYKKTASNIQLRRYLNNIQFTNLSDGISETIDWFIEALKDDRARI